MENFEVGTYIHKHKKKHSNNFRQKAAKLLKNVTVDMLIRPIAAFLIARAVVYGDIAPFGTSFYAATFTGKIPIISSVFLILGLFSANISLKFVIKNLLSLVVFSAVSMPVWDRVKNKTLYRALICAAAVFVGGAITTFSKSTLGYYLMVSLLEAVLSFAAVFAIDKAVPTLTRPKNLRCASDYDLIGLVVTIGLMLVGLSDLANFGQVSVTGVLCILVTLVFCMRYSPAICCTVGAFMGLICGIGGYNVLGCCAVFSLGALLGGMFSRFGKGGVALSFVLVNAGLSLYAGSDIVVNMYECVIALAIFVVLPRPRFEWLSAVTPERRRVNLAHKMQMQTSKKLKNYSDSFEVLSQVFEDAPPLAEQDLASSMEKSVINRAVTKVCASCGLKNYCWKKDFHATYDHMQTMLERTREAGTLSKKDIPTEFSKTCLHTEEVTCALICAIELENLERIWQSRVQQSRSLIKKQLAGVSHLMENLSEDAAANLLADEDMEEKILNTFSKSKVKIKDIFAGYNMEGALEVSLTMDGCGGFFRCDREAATLLCEATGRKMERTGLRDCANCRVKYAEAETWSVVPGCAALAADGRTNGDSYSFARLEGGSFLIALSDGMGTGPRARKQSKTTVNLIGKLLGAGFDTKTAVEMVNSVLITKSAEESFATIDLAILNLRRGICEFIKIGAATTFVKRRGGHVEVVRSTTLPAGVLESVETENITIDLGGEDMLIMMTDGVLDADAKSTKKEEWVKSAIASYDGDDPQELAEFLLSCATAMSGGKKVDDMTVLTAKIVLN